MHKHLIRSIICGVLIQSLSPCAQSKPYVPSWNPVKESKKQTKALDWTPVPEELDQQQQIEWKAIGDDSLDSEPAAAK